MVLTEEIVVYSPPRPLRSVGIWPYAEDVGFYFTNHVAGLMGRASMKFGSSHWFRVRSHEGRSEIHCFHAPRHSFHFSPCLGECFQHGPRRPSSKLASIGRIFQRCHWHEHCCVMKRQGPSPHPHCILPRISGGDG